MAGDRLVSARAVLRALAGLRRQGSTRVMRQLEQAEPDLAEHLLEGLSLLHQKLSALGGPPRATRQLLQEIEALVLVCIEALRQAHYELWRKDAAGTPLEQLDSSLAADQEPDASQSPDSDNTETQGGGEGPCPTS
jgi:hypothetical protein